MNIDKNINQFDRFKYYSEQAAKSEKEGDYATAYAHWQVAALSAYRQANREWCQNRAIFCERVARKPF